MLYRGCFIINAGLPSTGVINFVGIGEISMGLSWINNGKSIVAFAFDGSDSRNCVLFDVVTGIFMGSSET